MNPKDYGTKLFNFIGAGCAAICVAMATDTGVIDVLLSADTPLSVAEISQKKGLKERYVRELLGSLVAAEVIQSDNASTLYHIPDSCKPVLRDMAPFCRMVPHFGQRFKGVKDCFPNSGPKGVPFSALPDIFNLMDGYRSASQDRHIENDMLAAVPNLRQQLEKGINVAEFGCGTGIILSNLAARFPASCFTGSDVVHDVVEAARTKASENKLPNINYEVYDLYNLPDQLENKFDWIYVDDVIHDLAYPNKALTSIRRALKPDGIFSMLDLCRQGSIAENSGDLSSCFLMTSSLLVCLPESSQYENSAQLGPSWTNQMAKEYLEKSGFRVVNVHHNPHDKHLVHFVCQV